MYQPVHRRPSAGALQMVCASLSVAQSAGTPQGYYQLHRAPADRLQLVYTDYAQRCQRLLPLEQQLCAGQPLHCPGGAALFWLDGSLYLVRLGSLAAPPAAAPAELVRLGPDGSVRQRLQLAPTQTFVPGTGIAARDGVLYFTVHCRPQPSNARLCAQLLALDTRTGRQQVLRSFTDTTVYAVVGAWGNCLAIRRITRTGRQQLMLYAPAGDTLVISPLSALLDGSCLFYANAMFYWEPGIDSVYRVSPRTNRRICLGQHLLQGACAVPCQMSGPVNGQLLLNCTLPGQGCRRWAFDLQDRQVRPTTLYTEDGLPLPLLAETDDHFLVRTGAAPSPAVTHRRQGPDAPAPHAPRLALIQKGDLWANAPNYLPIECLETG